MDRNFYHQTRAREHQREISRELATRHLLREANRNTLTVKRVKRLALGFAPVTIIVTFLVLHFLGL